MNKVELIGRLVKDPAISSNCGRFTLAVERRFKTKDCSADFISCIVFGKSVDFAEKYLHKGMKIGIIGHIQTGSFKNKDGELVYTTDVVVDETEFVESKNAAQQEERNEESVPVSAPESSSSDFMSIPDGIDESLPFC